jgi:putative ABC transport system permease protein
VLGRPVLLDGVATTIVGVMPAGFDGPRSRPGDIWLPFSAARPVDPARPLPVSVVARLGREVTPQAARARLEAMPNEAAERGRWTAQVETAREDFLYTDALSRIHLLVGGVALLLVMACVNVVSLLLGRNVSRRRELAVRLAMGARPFHIMRQVAVESLILSLGAALLGLLLASWAVSAMVPLIPRWFPRIAQIDLDWGVAAFATTTAMAAGLLVSAWPAWLASRQDLAAVMRSGERGHTGRGRRARTALVVVEAILAMIVLAAAAMLVGSFNRLNPTSPGFEYVGRTKFSVRFAGLRYRDRAARVAAVEDLAARLKAVPGVVDVSSVTQLPLTGTTTVFPVRLNNGEVSGRPPAVHFRAALPNYLSSMGMPILKGRGLSSSDTARSQPVAVVNEALVARMLAGREPLESELVIDEPDGAVVRRIVGIVRDVRGSGNDLRARPEVFVPYAQSPLTLASFVVRSGQAGAQVEAGIRRVVGAFDPALPVDRVEMLRAVVEKSVDVQRFFALLMGTFAVVAVLLAFVGVYAVAAWSVTQRTREIGVRLAVGATPGDISRLVLRYGAAVGLSGAIAGSLCATAATRLIESYLYGFPARQPALLAALAVTFALIVTLASYVPARRAMRVDPMVALRAD